MFDRPPEPAPIEPSESDNDYRDYVEHPRYGRGPRFTLLNPSESPDENELVVHWHSGPDNRIPMTAIRADTSKQVPGTMQVAYYFDSRRVCRDCNRTFIFFAEEQKHWYEELGFRLDVDCVRCHACRHQQQSAERARKRYDQLIAIREPSASEILELAAITVELIGKGTFPLHPRTLSRVKMWLKRVSVFPDYAGARLDIERKLGDLTRRS